MREIIKIYLEWKASYAQRAAVNYRIWLERLVLVCGEKELKDFSLGDFLIFKKWVERSKIHIQFSLQQQLLNTFSIFVKCKIESV